MKLSTKILFIVLLSYSLLLGVTYYTSLQIYQNSYEVLEKKQVKTDINTVKTAISELEDINKANLFSWSWWDEFYNFMVETNQKTKQAFLNTNFQPNVFSVYNLDLVLIYDMKGNLVIGKELTPDGTTFIPVPDDILKLFEPNGQLRSVVTHQDKNNSVNGLVVTSQGVLILASSNIYTIDGKGPSHGVIVFAQYVNDDMVRKLKTNTGLDLKFYSILSIQSSSELSEQYPIVLRMGTNQKIVNGDTLFIYGLLNDINGQPAAIIKINEARNVHQIAQTTLNHFIFIFLITSAFLALVLYYILKKVILNPLKKINHKINKAIKLKDFTLNIPVNEADGLSSIILDINKTFSRVNLTESLLFEIINSIPSPIIIVNINMNITNLNYLAEKYLQLSIFDLKERSIFSAFPYLEPCKQTFFDVLNNNVKQNIESIVYHSDLGERYLNVMIFPITTNEKKLLIYIEDVSNRVIAEQSLLHDVKLASIGSLTTTVANEVNRPISFMTNALKLLINDIEYISQLAKRICNISSNEQFNHELEEWNNNDELARFNKVLDEINQLVNKFLDKAAHIALIIKTLKDFSRADENEMREYNLLSSIDDVLTLLQDKMGNRIKIVKEYDHTATLVKCFPGKLKHVFMTVLLNAIEAIPHLGEIKIKVEHYNGKIHICFIDNGIGITKDAQPFLFQPFYTTKEERVGLGLSTAASIIHEHKGSIKIKSETGKGTEVIITLPIS